MFTREDFNSRYFGALALAIVLYFTAVRLLQNFLYRDFSRPENLFESFGFLFSRPEPLEMPFYLLGIVIIPLVAWFFYKLQEKGLTQYLWVVAGVGILAVLWQLFLKISHFNFAMYFAYIQEHSIGKALWLLLTKRIFISRLAFLAALAGFVLVYLKKLSLRAIVESEAVSKVLRLLRRPAILLGTPRNDIWFDIFFLLLITFLIFHPNLPTQDHHYNYFIGSVNDILHGKPLLYETSHLYGLLNIYFLAAVFKWLLPFTYKSLSLILFVFYLAFFTCIYYFLKNWLQSRSFAILGTLTVLSIFYFFNSSPTRSIYFFPANSPFRFWLLLPVMFLVLAYIKNAKRIFKESAVFLSSLSLFWNFDHGIFLAAATFLTFLMAEKFSWTNASKLFLHLLIYTAAVFGAITIGNFVIYKSWPNWLFFFKEISPFSKGIGMSPLPLFGIFDFFILVYLGTAVWLLQRYLRAKPINLALVFLTAYGIFSLLYYVGESSWQNLTFISTPAILLAFYYFKNFPQERLANAAYFGLLVYALIFFVVKLPVEFNNRDYRNLARLAESEPQELYQDAQYLKEHFQYLPRIPLIHLQDTRLLVMTEKVNGLDFYYLFNLYYREDIEKEIERIKHDQPKYIFIGTEKNDQVEYFVSLLPREYVKIKSLNTLDIYATPSSSPP